MDHDPYKMKILRLMCRSAMIYIQERAADLVVDLDKAKTMLDENGWPTFVQGNTHALESFGAFFQFPGSTIIPMRGSTKSRTVSCPITY
jgi:hypothetical protein